MKIIIINNNNNRYNTDFLPYKLGTGFKKWERNGLVVLDELFDGGILMSYEQLRHKYNLPANDLKKNIYISETLSIETQKMVQTMYFTL